MTKTKAKAAEPAEPIMYVGPAKRGRLHIQAGTVFAGGVLPQEVREFADRSPAVAGLFVPVSLAAKARAQLRNPKSAMAKAFAEVAKMEV